MVGMWIAFAFAAGMVVVGFKSRQLKWYEFIVSGLFVLLLDRLVFHGQISAWVGQLGSKAQGAAAHSAMVFPFLLTGTAWAKTRRFAAKLWAHRPTGGDYIAYLLVAIAAHLVLHWGWLVCFGVYGLILVAFTVVAALLDRAPATRTLPAHQAAKPPASGAGESDQAQDGAGVSADG